MWKMLAEVLCAECLWISGQVDYQKVFRNSLMYNVVCGVPIWNLLVTLCGLLGPARVQSETCVSQWDRRPHGSRPGGSVLDGLVGFVHTCTVSAFHTLTGRCLFRMEDGVGWVEETCFLRADVFRNRDSSDALRKSLQSLLKDRSWKK